MSHPVQGLAKPIELVELDRVLRRLAGRKKRGRTIFGPTENPLVIVA